MSNGPPKFQPPPKPIVAKPPGTIGGPAVRAPKTFTIGTWTGQGQGKKILLYAGSGMGKTTLASMAPNPIYIGLDDGGREIRNPKTGEPLQAVQGVGTFEDVRDVLHNVDFPKDSTLVIDTVTELEVKAVEYMLREVKTEKGTKAESIEGYGWGAGYDLLLDQMRYILSDLDAEVRKGVNVILLAQQSQGTVANLAGTDYLQDGPALETKPKARANVRAQVCAWVDNIFRIGYPDVTAVDKAGKDAKKGKAIGGSTERFIYTEPKLYFVAKNRMNGKLPPVMPFATRDDDSIWQAVFHGVEFTTETE